jgi:hypothetical protein
MTVDTEGLLGQLKLLVIWQKAHPIPGLDPSVWRRDDQGNTIRYQDYGDRKSQYGWEADHHPLPRCFGGTDETANLRPLHWHANAQHGGILSAVSGILR